MQNCGHTQQQMNLDDWFRESEQESKELTQFISFKIIKSPMNDQEM